MNPLIKLINRFYPGYCSCYRCGRNWGWAKYVIHPTSESRGLLLFCVACDKKVTIPERWRALDKWKQESIAQCSGLSSPIREEEIKRIQCTEFLEFRMFECHSLVSTNILTSND